MQNKSFQWRRENIVPGLNASLGLRGLGTKHDILALEAHSWSRQTGKAGLNRERGG